MTDQTFEDWTPLARDTWIPKGQYDVKINDENDHYLTELRITVDERRMTISLDHDLKPAFSGKVVFVVSAKAVPFSVASVTIAADEYDFLVNYATIGINSLKLRANRQLNHQKLFRIVSNARRAN